MNIDLLRAEYTTKLQAAKDLLEKTMRASQDHIVRAATASEPELRGRVMTPEEASAVQTLYDEAKTLKGRLDQATNMSAMSTEIERPHRGHRGPAGSIAGAELGRGAALSRITVRHRSRLSRVHREREPPTRGGME